MRYHIKAHGGDGNLMLVKLYGQEMNLTPSTYSGDNLATVQRSTPR